MTALTEHDSLDWESCTCGEPGCGSYRPLRDRRTAREMRLRSGIDYKLEEQADKMLADARRQTTASLSDRRDYLTRDQMRLCLSREVYNSTGVSDESLMRGLFNRTYNPEFGQRPNRNSYSDD